MTIYHHPVTSHHYVPRCYQLGFADPDPPRHPLAKPVPMIWQGRLATRAIRCRPTDNVGCASGFYALGFDDPNRDEAAERAHGRLETAVAPVLKALNAGELQVGQEAWENLLFFAAVLATRGPRTKDMINGMRRRGQEIILDLLANMSLDSFIHQLRKSHPGKTFTREKARELQEGARNPQENFFPVDNGKVVTTSLKTAQDTIFPLFLRMHWTYLHAPHTRPFLCSDTPVAWVDPTAPPGGRGHGLQARNIEVSFPVGHSLVLLGHWEAAPQHLYLTDDLVDQINLRTIERARVEILGPSRESVEWGLGQRSATRSANTGK